MNLFKTIVAGLSIGATVTLAEEFNMNGMPPPDMHMEYSVGELKAGSKLDVSITVPDNWHVNANVAADEFLKPSEIEASADGIVFGAPQWPEAIKEYNKALDFDNLVFRGNFHVILPIDSVAPGYDSLGTSVTFSYQACDNSICLAPSKKTIKLTDVGFGSANANSDNQEKPSFNLKKNDGEVADAESPREAAPAQKAEAADPLQNNVQQQGEGPATQQEGNASNAQKLTQDIQKAEDFAGDNAGELALLLFAFLGGIILNLMPCVLPVLSLKLFSLIKQAGESRSRLFALGLSTAAGILASFWTLAAVMIVVKIGGGNIGWGMQFQSAGFIAFMVVILTAFAMSFLGVFEVWLPGSATTKMDAAGHKHGLGGAFFTGALLVLLSTPCSAPFLGTAMGFAFTASAPVLVLFFTAAGLGLALPYVLVSAFPAVLKFFPKPGIWMVKLQKVMGILLLGTVAWLFWIVNEQAGLSGVGIFAVVATLSAAASFTVGKFAPPGTAFVREAGCFAAGAIVIIGLWFGMLSPKYEAAITSRFESHAKEQMTEDGWYKYTPELIENFKAEGRTVFIDVSADWCLTCKANEAAVLGKQDFIKAMDSLNVARVMADWTRETPEVNALLKSMGKSGVPAYAIYPQGDAAKQIVLPEILTTGGIVAKITGK